MKYLLDTHTFLWAIFDAEKLGKQAFNILNNPRNQCFLSIASIWELSIKVRLGKLEFHNFKLDEAKTYCKKLKVNLLPIDVKDAVMNSLLSLKPKHRDPFDRMLIATAIQNDWTLLSCDDKFEQYKTDGLKVLW